MVLVSAAARWRWLAFGLSTTLTCIGLAAPVRGTRARNTETLPRTLAGTSRPDASAESGEIKDLIAKYALSIDEADTGLASQIWLDSPEVSFIHPLGHEHGVDQIKNDVYRHLMGDTFSERRLSTHDIAVHVHGDSAWVEFYWDFTAKYRKNGSTVTTHGRETQVYWKEQGRWRLVHVHYSAMPITE